MQNGSQPRVTDSLRKVGAGILRLYKARFELSLIELREEIARVERRLILLELLGLLLTMGCLCLTGVVVVLLSRAVGWAWAFGICTFIYLAAAVFAFLALQKERKASSEPFAQTLREFEKDAERFSTMFRSGEEPGIESEPERAAANRISPLL